MTGDNSVPFRRLCAALLLRAARDAKADDHQLAAEARAWLADEGTGWAEALGLHPDKVAAFLGNTSPSPLDV